MTKTIHLDVDAGDVDARIDSLKGKAEELVDTLEKANSLAGELASSLASIDVVLEIRAKAEEGIALDAQERGDGA